MPATTPKYELLDDDFRLMGASGRVFRIRALRDIPEQRVKAGDLGGYVESERNLSHTGAAWIGDRAVAMDRSRVEGDALARGDSVLSDYAVLTGSAVLDGFAAARGHSVIRGTSRVRGSASVEDTVLVEGNLDIRHNTRLSGDSEYRDQRDVPWSLRDADPAEPDYLDRLREAVEIDPAFHRVLAALGATDAAGRAVAVDELFNGSKEGRKALVDIAKAIGGVFTSDAYEPRSVRDLVSGRSMWIAVDMASSSISSYRYLYDVTGATGHEQGSGATLHAAVVRVRTSDPDTGAERTSYQPALVQEAASPFPTLMPFAPRVLVAPDAYDYYTDAVTLADHMLREAITPQHGRALVAEMRPRPLGARADLPGLDRMPFVAETRRIYDPHALGTHVAVTMQKATPDATPLARQVVGGLTAAERFAVIEMPVYPETPIDLAIVSSRLDYQPTIEQALGLVEPVYAGRADFMARITREIAARETRIAELRKLASLSDGQDDSIYSELHDLDPANVAVLAKVIDAPAAEPVIQPERTTPTITPELLRATLQPLEWEDVFEAQHPHRFADEVQKEVQRLRSLGYDRASICERSFEIEDAIRGTLKEARSLNARFAIEKVDDTWSLYVDNPKDDPFKDRPYHRLDGLPTAEAAMDAAEAYRVDCIIAELAPPAQDLALSADVRFETAEILRPEYTHVLFSDLKGEDEVSGRLVPISDAFRVMDETHHRPSKFVTAEGVAKAEIVRPETGAPWRKVEKGTAWVMRVFSDTSTGKPVALEAGNASPFTVARRVVPGAASEPPAASTPQNAKGAGTDASVELPAAFRFRHSNGVSYKAGSVTLAEGRYTISTHGDLHKTLEEAADAAVRHLHRAPLRAGQVLNAAPLSGPVPAL